MSSPNRYSAWEAWETNPSKPGRTKLNGIWRIVFERFESHRWRADGVHVENIPRIHQLWTSSKIFKQRWKNYSANPELFNDRIIFMSMYNDIVWREQGDTENVKIIRLQLRIVLADFRAVVGHSWDLGQKRNGTTLTLINQMVIGRTAERLMLNPTFRATSALERGELRSKAKGKKSIHFRGSEENIELILRTIISVNQLSIHGAVADLCVEPIQRFLCFEETWCTSRFGDDGNSYWTSYCWLIPTESCRETCCKTMSVNSNYYLTTSDAGLKICRKRILLHHTWCRRRTKSDEGIYVEEYTLPRNKKASPARGWIIGNMKNRPGLGWKGLSSSRLSRYWNFDRISVSSWNSFMGLNRERNQQVCYRNDRNHFLWECWAQSYRETCCQSETTTETRRDAVFHFCPSTWKKMDGRQSWEISSRLLRGVKSHDPIAATWSQFFKNMMEQYDLLVSWKIQERVRWCCAMVN